MAEEEQQRQQESPAEGQSDVGSGATGTAVKAAAAAAATGVAALAAKKALSGRGTSNGQSTNGAAQKATKVPEGPSVMSTVLAGGWEAARDALIPAAEDAAGAAGEYVAHNGPEILRDRIVPRFIDSFNQARGER